MHPPEGERLATLERALVDVEKELAEVSAELVRNRKRLHDLEGLVGMLVNAQKEGRREEESQYRRLEIKIQWLAVAVAFAGVLVAIAVAVTHH